MELQFEFQFSHLSDSPSHKHSYIKRPVKEGDGGGGGGGEVVVCKAGRDGTGPKTAAVWHIQSAETRKKNGSHLSVSLKKRKLCAQAHVCIVCRSARARARVWVCVCVGKCV